MKKIISVLISLFLSFFVNAQKPNIALEDKVIKVKLAKSISYEICKKTVEWKNAVVLEFDVLLPEDKKIFGDKIYAATVCEDYPGDGLFERNDTNLQLSYDKRDEYKWDVSIINENLFEKNVGRKKYWVKRFYYIYTKTPCYSIR